MLRQITLATAVLFAMQSVQAADITVSAAASLKEAFTEIAKLYEKQNPQDKIKLNTAASGVLLQQLAQGAPVDVLATADTATMDKANNQKLIVAHTRKNFARNSLVLVTPKKSTVRVKTLADLRQANVKRIAVGKPESVPAGAYAKAALEKNNLFNQLNNKYIYTQNVRQALDYVFRGEVDAGFVYRTDAQLKQFALNITGEVPTVQPVIYPIATTTRSQHAAEAKRFTDFVLSPEAQSVLQRYGFSKP
ncbi:molybdate ABC transporter substrate-binding protein [Kingella negevensis]|uniref:molybdate ABC transporter substrate-binding protein n=1 Tax=Kingella negevensis TaxID=1522312 RepID=UPI00050A16F6|nr:molybdate ABC transporter substrate-binding protein [Kingella negevensis]MDK4688337.1 molybdate ABC transporter substrate-binding protein [Kingella negevensis]WII91957.1 molybdate ABC transporter substrate-binding protein [Kingella negevensis]